MESVLKIFGAGLSLLSGYVFIRFSPYRAYRTEHLRTDRFALHVLGYSILFYALGELSAWFIELKYPYSAVDSLLDDLSRDLGLGTAVISSLILAFVASGIDRFFILFLMLDDIVVREHRWRDIKLKSKRPAMAL